MIHTRRGLLAGLIAAALVGMPADAEARARGRRRRARGAAGGASLRGTTSGACPCDGGDVCTGPRGGRYCITSSGRKRYGV